ncbi:MAG: hypothetical protein NC340_03295 [Ruminococcus flavefaciens]|nr:hypothetical protein [Ruminococcus flavefaciens]MCM1229578.1 hypothetical protein [Ruminococcus flavefaciens]
MAENIEIERKFLVNIPAFDKLNITRKIGILQTYLLDGTADGKTVQRRVRKITENGGTVYVYTEKIFVSAMIRNETEYEITCAEYNQLLQEHKPGCVPIEKQRICFEYHSQMFELDVYPFSDRLATLELELENPEQEIFFPEYVEILREVTGNKAYSNAELANAGKFPDYKEI